MSRNRSAARAVQEEEAKTGLRPPLAEVLLKQGVITPLLCENVQKKLLANQQGGTIRATARPVRVGRRVTVIRTEVRGDGEQLLAEVTTTHVPT